MPIETANRPLKYVIAVHSPGDGVRTTIFREDEETAMIMRVDTLKNHLKYTRVATHEEHRPRTFSVGLIIEAGELVK